MYSRVSDTDPTRMLPPGPTRLMLNAAHEHKIKCASYLTYALKPELRRGTVFHIIRIFKYFDFDAIAFRGLSGALVAPIVAMEMDKTLLAVRKTIEDCHSGLMVEGDYAARRYLILDDMISTGQTVHDIIKEIRIAIPYAKCLGVLPYLGIDMMSTVDRVQPPPERIR
jgi:adenine/guanine phosphoribosyltransferase-like PRPP-binding protein